MIPGINTPLGWAAAKIGLPLDQFKLMLSFLLSYPLAGVLKRVPDDRPAYKNVFIIGVATFYLVGLFDLWTGCRTLFISSAGAYCIAKYIHGPYMPWVGYVFLMTHMSINQLDRQFRADPDTVDITGAQMVLVMKLSAFCWNVADGRLPDKLLNNDQKERALRHLPSILDYAGYVLFFPSLMIGPSFDYVDYRRWLDATMFELPEGVDPSKAPPTKKARKIPRSGTPAAWKAAAGASWAVAFLIFSGRYYPELLTGPEYMTYGFLRRVWLMYILGVTTRLKYYTAWSLTEGACILSGLGYRGVDPVSGKISWDRLQNVSPWGVETAQNTRAYLGSWNMNTNNWLRNYIYLRVTPRGRKPGFQATLATFVASALWHGFYPGYYLTFVLASFVQTVAKNCRRYIRPFCLDPATQKPTSLKIYYDIASYLITQLTFSFVTAPFVLLTLSSSFMVWSRVYMYAVLGTAAATAFFASPAKLHLKKMLEARAKKVGNTGILQSSQSTESLNEGHNDLGVPDAGDKEGFDRMIKEVREDMETRQRRGAGIRHETM